jgi:hypothetical protein
MRADEEKRMAERKKQEEERRVREIEEKKQRDIEEKRRRLEEAEKKRQAMMQALKVRKISVFTCTCYIHSESNFIDDTAYANSYFYRNKSNRRGQTSPFKRRIHQ